MNWTISKFSSTAGGADGTESEVCTVIWTVEVLLLWVMVPSVVLLPEPASVIVHSLILAFEGAHAIGATEAMLLLVLAELFQTVDELAPLAECKSKLGVSAIADWIEALIAIANSKSSASGGAVA